MSKWPVFELQEWDWEKEKWETSNTYEGERGEGNAYFGVELRRSNGPVRLLKDGEVVLSDNPDTYYDEEEYLDEEEDWWDDEEGDCSIKVL